MPSPSSSRPDSSRNEITVDLTALGVSTDSDVALHEISELLKLIAIQAKRLGGDPITEKDEEVILDYFDHAFVTPVTVWAMRQFPQQWNEWLARDRQRTRG